MVVAIHRSPARDIPDNFYTVLASLARYGRVEVLLDDAKYAAAVSQLDADDIQRAAAAFTLQDIRGQTWDSKNLRGKVVLVTFWSTSCPPCREEMPDLERLYQRFRTKGLVLLAISSDDAADLSRYAAARKITLPLLMDPENQVMQRFRVAGIPKSFLYDREGHLAGQTLDRPGASGWNELLTLVGLHSSPGTTARRDQYWAPIAVSSGYIQGARDRCGAIFAPQEEPCRSQRLRLQAQAIQLRAERVERGGAMFEIARERILLQAAQYRGGGICAHIGTSALTVMCQALASFRIPCADGEVQEFELLGRIFDERGEHLAHQILVFQGNVPKLLAIQDQVGISGST